MNSHGIPSLKELYAGILIDVDHSPNRHLRMAGLDGRQLYLEMIEVPADLEDDEEEEGTEEGDYDPLGLMGAIDDDDFDEDEEVCNDYPGACPTCEDLECGHEVDDLPEEDLIDQELRVMVIWPALGNTPKEMTEDDLEQNPALCRFLAQINDHNGL